MANDSYIALDTTNDSLSAKKEQSSAADASQDVVMTNGAHDEETSDSDTSDSDSTSDSSSDSDSDESVVVEAVAPKKSKKAKKDKEAKQEETVSEATAVVKDEPETDAAEVAPIAEDLATDDKKDKKKKKKSKGLKSGDDEDVVIAEEPAVDETKEEKKAEKKRKRAAEAEADTPAETEAGATTNGTADAAEDLKEQKRKKKKAKKAEAADEEYVSKSSTDRKETNTDGAEQWHVQALDGGDARKEKFLRLLGAKKAATSGDGQGVSAGSQSASKHEIASIQNDLERQFEAGMRMKDQGGRKKGLGA